MIDGRQQLAGVGRPGNVDGVGQALAANGEVLGRGVGVAFGGVCGGG